MTSYREITNQVADQWVAALKNAEQVAGLVADGAQRVTKAAPIPAPFQELNDVIADKLPEPREIVEVNFELTNRLLSAQRDLTLKLLEANSAKDDSKPAAGAKKSTSK